MVRDRDGYSLLTVTLRRLLVLQIEHAVVAVGVYGYIYIGIRPANTSLLS